MIWHVLSTALGSGHITTDQADPAVAKPIFLHALCTYRCVAMSNCWCEQQKTSRTCCRKSLETRTMLGLTALGLTSWTCEQDLELAFGAASASEPASSSSAAMTWRDGEQIRHAAIKAGCSLRSLTSYHRHEMRTPQPTWMPAEPACAWISSPWHAAGEASKFCQLWPEMHGKRAVPGLFCENWKPFPENRLRLD